MRATLMPGRQCACQMRTILRMLRDFSLAGCVQRSLDITQITADQPPSTNIDAESRYRGRRAIFTLSSTLNEDAPRLVRRL